MTTPRLSSSVLVALVVLCGLAGSACTSAPPPAPKPAGKKVDAATAGSISGKVTFTGKPPAPEFIKMGVDPACVQGAGPKPESDAVLIAKDGSLQNAFVYIKDGLDPSYTFDVPTAPVELDQKGCRYSPRIIGVMVGQPIELANGDPTFHNIHALPKVNQEFNQSLQVQGARFRKTFTAPEVMVRFKCDVHGWMAAYVGVLAHPFFAVSRADGSFELKGVPPGTYTLEAWHEQFGTRTAQVTVGDHEAGTASFSFAAN